MPTGGELQRVPFPRGSGPARTSMGPAKRKPKTSDEVWAKEIVGARSGGVCEGCGRERATDWSHRVSKSGLGPWHPSNGLDLCRLDHDWGHDQPIASRKLGWLLKSTDDFVTFPALHWLHGWVLLGADGGFTPSDPPVFSSADSAK